MKNFHIWATSALLLGVAAIIYMNRRQKSASSNASLKVLVDEEIIPLVQQEEASKYTNALLKQYEVVLPTAVASKRVREKAEVIARERRRIHPKKVKTPISVNEL